MWELGMGIESGFVLPLGVNEKSKWRTRGFEEVDGEAANFGARGREDGEQFFAQLLFLSRDRIEANKRVDRHGAMRGRVLGFCVGRKEADRQISGSAKTRGRVENDGDGIDDDRSGGDVAVCAAWNRQADVRMAG